MQRHRPQRHRSWLNEMTQIPRLYPLFVQDLFTSQASPVPVSLLHPPKRTSSALRNRNIMCRNIKTLHNFKPPATDEEIRASAVQFVRKLSGFTKPSKTNEVAFYRAVDQVTEAAHELLDSLVTNAPPRDREVEAAKARARAAERFRNPEARAN